ncbi:unnamed protein product (macronuclear) [Paramecium tetraurelia]|uniref:Transmembrane protein n=1 Tax=Paramecium tetraurelia TaxID=5888 RepID=A0CH63_PARTE|nr:uncharacterized protein GSPATT00007570001 [Paramecium tetraurelia]CAK70130.1 unnamed protein product [Paramecium tetraurelia]|eukprot:XP_001437527.1 hypothetical protein (macronuclear) [Paramecium tetraurelia strain d4-2]
MPIIILYALGAINEMQNISYITVQTTQQVFSSSSENNILRAISRPNTYLTRNAILSYIITGYLCIFFICCFIFIYMMKIRSADTFIKLSQAFNKNISQKILMKYINISINLIKYGFGIMAIEICLQNIKANFDDDFQIALNVINIITILITLVFLTYMFTYNWALDFKREHLSINDSILTYIRILIKLFQMIILYFSEQRSIYLDYFQILLPMISAILLIYQIQIQKLLIYGVYFQIILIITIMTLVISFQCLFQLIFINYQFKSLWILLSIIPYRVFVYYIKRDLINNFINFLSVNLKNCNHIVFQIIYGMSEGRQIFQSDMIFLMFLQKHSVICKDCKCKCRLRLQEKQFQAVSYEVFFKELLFKYQQQLSQRVVSESLIFSYLQLLFFQKKYLLVYRYFRIIFETTTKSQENLKLETNRPTIKINSLSKLLILKVAQDLQRLDIQNQFQRQKAALKVDSLQNHLSIQEYLKITKQNEFIKQSLSNVIDTKIEFFQCLNQKHQSKNLEQIALKSIQTQMEGLKIIKASFQSTQTQRYSNILRFYYMEVLNDLISAQSIVSPQNTEDEYVIKTIHSNFQNQLSYMTVAIQDLDNIQIIKHKYNQQDQQTELVQLSFDQMIPNYMKLIHSPLIEKFISGMENKFFQQLNQAYIEYSSGLCKRIELIMDLSQLNLQSIEMILFFQKQNESTYSIFLDENKQIVNIEEELFCKIFDIDTRFAKQLNGIDISVLFENFASIKFNEKHFSQFFRFFDQRKLNHQSQRNQENSLLTKMEMILYKCDLEVMERQMILGTVIYQLNLSNIKKINKSDEIGIENQQQQNASHGFDELINTNKHFDFNSKFIHNKLISQQNNNKPERITQDEILNNNFQQNDILFTPKIDEEHYILSQEGDQKTVQKLYENKQKSEAASRQSSLSAVQKSQYHRQFSLVYNLSTCRKSPKIFLRKTIQRLLYLIISIIGFILHLQVVSNFDLLLSDFKLLSFKNSIFYPISTSTLIRFSIINYNVELYINLITKKQWSEYLEYPNSKILESYDKLKQEISDLLEQQLFFTHYSRISLQLEFLEYGNKGIQEELNLRNSLVTLLNYQYDSKVVYSNGGTADSKSPYFFYVYKNFNLLLQTFEKVDTGALLSLQSDSQYYQSQLLNIMIYTLLLMSIMQILISISHYSYCLQKEELKILLFNQEHTYIISDIQRLHNLKELIMRDFTQILQYQFNFQDKDTYFQNLKLLISKSSQKKKKVILPIDFFNIKSYLLIISHFLILLAIYIGLQIELGYAYNEIRNAAEFYQSLTRLNTNILVMYSSREVLYYKQTFTFFTQTDIDQYHNNCEQGINELEDYVTNLWNYQSNSYIIDKDFNPLFSKFSEGNLCNYLDEINQNSTVCNSSLFGNLQKGLTSTIINIKNTFRSEFESTNFTNRTLFPIQELEGIIIISQAFQYLIESFYELMQEQCLYLIFFYNVKFQHILNRCLLQFFWCLVCYMDWYY